MLSFRRVQILRARVSCQECVSKDKASCIPRKVHSAPIHTVAMASDLEQLVSFGFDEKKAKK